jgi:hypothetical protein
MPQGHPVIVQAGASEQGRELGAATADVIYAINATLDGARNYYADVKARMAKYGREPDDLKIMPAFCPVVGRTRAEAQAKYDQLQTLIDPLAGLGSLIHWTARCPPMPLATRIFAASAGNSSSERGEKICRFASYTCVPVSPVPRASERPPTSLIQCRSGSKRGPAMGSTSPRPHCPAAARICRHGGSRTAAPRVVPHRV